MANIQIGKYKRPGIFINEFDQSVNTSPTVEGITNLVIGTSKKGPVNTPIRLTNISELESVFGQIDRSLERKGSFFHRTISKMLETSPVFAMNLLLTDDDLDTVEFKSISTSAGTMNSEIKEGPYRRIFDTTGFWKRDTESFLNLADDNTKAFNLTNLSDKDISVFVIKSGLSGFDRTLLEWYGSEDRIPPYVSSKDFASDYLVDVVVVSGDWSDYKSLSVDNRWGAYFNEDGLIKENLRDFANDRNINLLEYYEGLSLLPYFRDLSGNNIFIETLINRDTDRTGLFCAFNNDAVEQDSYNGLLDIIGNTIARDVEVTDIDFLSYKEKIKEDVEFVSTPLDLPGNVTAIMGGTLGDNYNGQATHAFGSIPVEEGEVENGNNRTAYFAEGSVYGVRQTGFDVTPSNIEVEYTIEEGAFGVIDDEKVDLAYDTGIITLTLENEDYPTTSGTASYVSALTLDINGGISFTNSSNENAPRVSQDEIVLSYIDVLKDENDFDLSSSINSVSVDSGGFVDLVSGTDYQVTDLGNGDFKVEFLDTATIESTSNYRQSRRFKMYNRLVSIIDSVNKDRVVMSLGTSGEKVSLADVTIDNIVTTTDVNKEFTLRTPLSQSKLVDVIDGYLVFYTEDNEFILGTDGAKTKMTEATASEGVIGKYSEFYDSYNNGIINTRDFIVQPASQAGETENVYLQMYLDDDSNMVLNFTDIDFTAIFPIDTLINDTITVKSRLGNLKQSLEIEDVEGYNENPNRVLVNGTRYTEVRVGDFLLSTNDTRRLTRIISKRRYSGDSNLVEISCDSEIEKKDFNGDRQTTRYVSVDNYASTYKSVVLKGFKKREESLPDGTEEKQNKILNLMAKGTPLFKAVTNKEAVDFRYLIDSFGLGLTENSKQQLVDICGERLDAFGFINMPSLRQFKKSPNFVDSEGRLQVKFLAEGGDKESINPVGYSFAQGTGTTAVGYFTPYVTVNDEGRPLEMPPASYVASTYMRKHISNITSITPWTIAAGVTNGRVTNITGLEMDYNNEDIEFLNENQINPIVFKRNRGYIIETENTAQTLFNSALSFIHVREVLIELERELSSMLLEYQWRFNTPDVRSEIKLRADVICETYVSKNGLFNFFNKMDDENNTPEIIDNQIGVLDTYVEPIRGMGIIVNNITILRTGAISAGGFINS